MALFCEGMIHIRVGDSTKTLCGTSVLKLSRRDAFLPVDLDEFVTSRKARVILPPLVWRVLPQNEVCLHCINVWMMPPEPEQ